MKKLYVNRKFIVSILTIVVLIYGFLGVSYALKTPIIEPGDSDTALKISVSDFFKAFEKKTYEIEIRRKTLLGLGNWRRTCFTIRNDQPRQGTATFSFTLTGLEPDTTYEVRCRDTNLPSCGFIDDSDFIADSWSEIGEGTTSGGEDLEAVGDNSNQTRYAPGENILTLPAGSWAADLLSNSAVISGKDRSGKEKTTVEFSKGGRIEKDGITYTCLSNGGCKIEDRRVVKGIIQVTGVQESINKNRQQTDTPRQTGDPSDRRIAFEASRPTGYIRVTLSNRGSMWGVPSRYTTDSNTGTVAYMLLGKLKGCDFATAELARESKVYIKTQSLGRLNDFQSETVCGQASRRWTSSWDGVRITHLRFFDESSPDSINEATYNTETGQYDLTAKPTTESVQRKENINGDGTVSIQDLVLVAINLGKTGQNDADVNSDGVVDIRDLVKVAGALGNGAAAPSLHPQSLEMLTATEVKQWLSTAQHLDLTDTMSQRGILFLQQLLITLTPKETALLANYPNPFNPETWIPYHLSTGAEVTLHIYAVNGTLVRTLTLGHQPAGMYQSRSRAAYWDGKNAFGEPVASGLYFYTFIAGDFTATRKMLVRK